MQKTILTMVMISWYNDDDNDDDDEDDDDDHDDDDHDDHGDECCRSWRTMQTAIFFLI